ncbi:MAG: metal-dependent hydrolase [Bacteroidia bacterium]|nr:metal-dependent hydrolase [Bacteroidia bacterium]
MATSFGHAVVAYTTCKFAKDKVTKKLLILSMISSALPDIDVLGFYAGIPYESMLGHRGFTHSILFAFLWSWSLSKWQFKHAINLAFPVLLFSTLSHGIIDALTTGGRGVGFFIPFSSERFFFPTRFIQVSPLHFEDFFGEWGKAVVFSEFLYIVLPCLILIGFRILYQTIEGNNTPS